MLHVLFMLKIYNTEKLNTNLWKHSMPCLHWPSSDNNNGKSIKERQFTQFSTEQLSQTYTRYASCIMYAKNY